MKKYREYNHFEKIYKRTTTFLKRWNGGKAIIETITTSHATLVINIYKSGNQGWLRLSCIDPIWIKGFRMWEFCEIRLQTSAKLKNGETGYILFDEKGELEVHCSAFESSEHLPKKSQVVI